MKLRPLTWSRWLELGIGVFIPAIYTLPFLVQTSWFALSPSCTHPNVSEDLWFSAPVVVVTFVAIVAFLLLGALILVGPEQVNQRVALRASMTAMGSIGLIVGTLFFLSGLGAWIDLFAKRELWGLFSKRHFFTLGTWEFILFEDARFISLMLVGPLVIGLRYLRALLRR